jgi:hypothetical protein
VDLAGAYYFSMKRMKRYFNFGQTQRSYGKKMFSKKESSYYDWMLKGDFSSRNKAGFDGRFG